MNTSLPIFNKKNEIIEAIKNNDTVILTAETGSGKSTQVPQYLHEVGYNVIVTQPRRIACITLAERVGEEMDNSPVVGYHTAFESTRTPDTRILFCTDGLQMAKGIKEFENTVLVLDEVHEWNLNIETLVAWIKKFREDGNQIKVILMSATIESELLKDYYATNSKVACINVEGRYYDVEKTEVNPNKWFSLVSEQARKGKNILIFEQGKSEINNRIEFLREIIDFPVQILPLHGELNSKDQKLCFKHYSIPKIIVSTNIAQTSVTIPDVDVVIDFGTEKRIEIQDGIEGLFIHDISKADCLQRAGRAGRTKDGKYFLCSYHSLNNRDEYSTPEIQRLIIDKVVLKLASVGIDASELRFFHQPSEESIADSKKVLNLIRALNGNTITELGRRIVKFPVSVRSARMIIESEKLGCVDDIIKIVSILEVGSLVNFRQIKDEYVFEEHYKYSDFTSERKSDLLAELDIYNQILDKKFPDLRKAGIHKKNFFRIKEFHNKLLDIIERFNLIQFNNFSMDKFDRIKAIASGMMDNIYEISGDAASNHPGYHDYKVNRNSCTKYSTGSFAIGFPKVITYKDKWDCTYNMNLIVNISKLTEDELIALVGEDKIETRYSMKDISYNNEGKCFIIPYERYYSGFKLGWGTDYECIYESDERYQAIFEDYGYLIRDKEVKTIILNGNVYTINYNEWHDEAYVYIDNADDILNSDLQTYKYKGRPVEFHYSLMRNVNLDIIRKHIIEQKIENAYYKFRSTLPDGKTGSIKLIIKEYLPKLGKNDLSMPQYGVEKFIYTGLKLNKKSAYIDTFDSEELATESTNETLRFLMAKEAESKYNDKKFVVKIDGKKVETKKAKQAKEDFHAYLRDILSETTLSNFQSNLEFLQECYDECIASMAI